MILDTLLQKWMRYAIGRLPSVEDLGEKDMANLGRVLKRLLYSPPSLRRRLQQHGVNVVPANFYSEIPTLDQIENTPASVAGEFDSVFDDDTCARVLERLVAESGPFDPPVEGDVSKPDGFFWKNPAFSYADAMSCYAFMRAIKPRTVIEIGSGWSTLVTRQALADNGDGEMLCIEPYPLSFLSDFVPDEALLKEPVQDIAVEFFNDTLQDGDVLFIDSTHTVKHGSDCLYIYLKVLPALRRNVFIHVHDIHLPGPLPVKWMRDLQLYWTEQYLLYAYLLGNPRTRVLYGSAYHGNRKSAQFEELMHQRYLGGGASFWFYQGEPEPLRTVFGVSL